MTSLRLVLPLVLLAAVLPLPVAAADDAPARARAALSQRFPTLKLGEFRATPLAGIYQFSIGVDVFYTDAAGRFVLRGDLLDFGSDRNLSEERRGDLRLAQLATVPDAQTIVFGPADARHTVTVFTDIDCGYCRRMHQEIGQLNAAGVRVRYLFYPRAGLGSESWQKAVDVWCAKDRKAALTAAKAGRAVPRGSCDAGVVARHHALGEALKLDGTPMVISPQGRVIGGYLPPADMVRQLDQMAAAPRPKD